MTDLDPAKRGSEEGSGENPQISPLPAERGGERFSWGMYPWKSNTVIFGLGVAAGVAAWFGVDLPHELTEPAISELTVSLEKALAVPLASTVGAAAGILITHYVNPFRKELRRIENPTTC